MSANAAAAPQGPATGGRDPRGLTILVVADCIHAGRIGGVEQMIYNLVRGLASRGHAITMLAHRPERVDPGMRSFVRAPASRFPGRRAAGWSRFADEQLACLDRTAAADAVIFPNYHTPPHVPRRLGRRVTVVHDLQYRVFPQHFTARKRWWLRWAHAWTLRRADAVVAISEHVRGSMARVYPAPLMGKVRVIHNPVSWDRFEAGPDPAVAPARSARPFILSVAAQYPHKNLATLIRAYAASKAAGFADLVLVGQWSGALGGPAARRPDLPRLVGELGLDRRVRVAGHVGDEELGRLYRTASLFALPSLYEGFGMPAVEALGLGLPALITRCGALEEVTLGEALYVENPADAGEWAARIDQVMADPQAWRPSAQTVRRIRERYSAARIAERYARLLAGGEPDGP